MYMRKRRSRLLFMLLAAGLAACNGDGSPSAPSGMEQPSQPAQIGVRVAGTASDAAWRPLTGARIEVVAGPQAGLATTTNAEGEFLLTGAFDETSRFRATKEGHAAAEFPLPARCDACNPPWWLHFHLEATAPRANLAGAYTLTVAANISCASLPDEARTRRYEALVTPSSDATNSRFDVAIKGSPFVEGYDRFTIGVAGDYVAADVGDWGHGSPGLVEQIAANTYLTIAGSFRGSATAEQALSGAFHGIVERCQLKTAWGLSRNCEAGAPVAYETCGPMPHQLTFTRR
jgi:hypothetical protein